jgi:hypothetical protein
LYKHLIIVDKVLVKVIIDVIGYTTVLPQHQISLVDLFIYIFTYKY